MSLAGVISSTQQLWWEQQRPSPVMCCEINSSYAAPGLRWNRQINQLWSPDKAAVASLAPQQQFKAARGLAFLSLLVLHAQALLGAERIHPRRALLIRVFLHHFQKINHFPGMIELCRKDLLARNLNRMLRLFPKEYNIFPRTWCLPAE